LLQLLLWVQCWAAPLYRGLASFRFYHGIHISLAHDISLFRNLTSSPLLTVLARAPA